MPVVSHPDADVISTPPWVQSMKSAPVVFDLDAFRASRTMVHHDDGPEAA